jgi:hypothetical protein
VTRPDAVLRKAKSVLRERGHNETDTIREYKDWHIEIRGGGHYVSVWSSAEMVFLSLAGVPVHHRPGPWEQYLDRLYHRMPVNAPVSEPEQ